jgi:hypothetical protein
MPMGFMNSLPRLLELLALPFLVLSRLCYSEFFWFSDSFLSYCYDALGSGTKQFTGPFVNGKKGATWRTGPPTGPVSGADTGAGNSSLPNFNDRLNFSRPNLSGADIGPRYSLYTLTIGNTYVYIL